LIKEEIMTSTSLRPLIGLTCCSDRGPDWIPHAPEKYLDFLFRDYQRGVEFAGGIPVLIPIVKELSTIKVLLDRIDGLILTGGPDVTTRVYGEEPKVGIRRMDYERDLIEIEATKEAKRRGIPMLGICRGIQLLAVAFGGTLHQDISIELPGSLDHNQKAPKRTNTHKVRLKEKSRLFEILEEEVLWVNSNHHQAIKVLPSHFVATAKASDGIIEAIEDPRERFLIGVQWHPEATWIHDKASQSLFAALVKAAGEVMR
jgi:putative glutamine amidotransferase